ncbi:MAG: hypothetical protein WBN32_05365 [Woeseia sp.]
MNSSDPNRRGSRLQLILIALIFVVPMIAASWMYYSDSGVRPVGRTNNGILLTPILNVPDELGDTSFLRDAGNRWVLVYLTSGSCGQDCKDALYKLRQSRLMLGNDMSRVVRVLLHGPEAPDRLFLEQEHAGLIAVFDPAARQLFNDVHPRNTNAEGFYLVDPLGNLIMYFPADISPRALVDDVEHLLKLSRIG